MAAFAPGFEFTALPATFTGKAFEKTCCLFYWDVFKIIGVLGLVRGLLEACKGQKCWYLAVFMKQMGLSPRFGELSCIQDHPPLDQGRLFGIDRVYFSQF